MVEHNETEITLYSGDKKPRKSDLVSHMVDGLNICNYYGHTYLEGDGLWKRLSETDFKSICYAVFGAGIPSAHIRDLEHYFMGSHNILPTPSKLISMGDKIWDMGKCDFVLETIDRCFFRSSITPNMNIEIGHNKFVKDLACNDNGVYNDIFSTIAVMFSSQKPDMVGFFYGDGSNGKSVLIDIVNKIIGNHISSINLERLTDQRDAPLINGTLANLCGENADNIVIEDSQTFKSIGSHERWSVHRMHTNDVIEIDTHPVHIFCVNNMPNFKDKSNAIIRRARVVPFKNKFEQDPSFRDSLLNDSKFLSDFLGEILLYCQNGKSNNWVTPMSEATQEQIKEYDLLRNSSKTFIDEYVHSGLIGFKDFIILGQEYENWCKTNGYTEMGTKNLRNAVMKHPFIRKNDSGGHSKIYMFEEYKPGKVKFVRGLYYNEVIDNTELDDDTTELLKLF